MNKDLEEHVLTANLLPKVEGNMTSVNDVVENSHIGINIPENTNEESDTPKPVCRICFEEEDDAENPFISPCLCSGSSRFVHRKCLQAWRETNHRADAFFKCEVCKFTYQFRRLFWAHIISNEITIWLVFLAIMFFSCWITGFIPVLPALFDMSPEVKSSIWIHFLNGMLVVAFFGLVATAIECIRGNPRNLRAPAITQLTCMPYCFIPDIACAEMTCLGLIVMTIMFGFAMSSYYAYLWIWNLAKLLMKRAEFMVENVS